MSPKVITIIHALCIVAKTRYEKVGFIIKGNPALKIFIVHY